MNWSSPPIYNFYFNDNYDNNDSINNDSDVSDDVINSVLIDKLGVWMKREYEKCSTKKILF